MTEQPKREEMTGPGDKGQGSERRETTVGKDISLFNWNRIGQDEVGGEQDWVIIMVIESGRELRTAKPRWVTQMHFQSTLECHSTPQGEDY